MAAIESTPLQIARQLMAFRQHGISIRKASYLSIIIGRIRNSTKKGVGQAITDLVAGRIDISLGPGAVLVPYVKAGKLKALGITAPNRWDKLPDVPTVDEAGVKGYAFMPFYGLWFPAGTPDQYVTRIQSEAAKAFEDPEIKRAFLDQGFVPVASTSAEFTKIVLAEIETNRRLAARIGLTPE